MIHCDLCGKENAKHIKIIVDKIIVDEKEVIPIAIKNSKSVITNLHSLPCDLCLDCQVKVMQTIKDMIKKPEDK
jgi:hypothetical protein